MIENATQLHGALEQLASFADTLEAMRRHSLQTNSTLFPVASEAYIKRIQELNREIRDYLEPTPEPVDSARVERIAS